MTQIHKRFNDEQVKALFQGNDQGYLSRLEIEELLGIGKICFLTLLRACRHGPDTFSNAYQCPIPEHLCMEVERQIVLELLKEKALIDDPQLPIPDFKLT